MKKIFLLLFVLVCFHSRSQTFPPFCLDPTASNYSYRLTSQDKFRGVNTLEINNDGKIDLIYPSTGFLKQQLGLGNGLFSNTTTTINSGGVTYEKIDVCDFNNDTKEDLFLCTSTASVAYLKNNGNGTFAPSYTIAGDFNGYTINDFNNDGYPDIISFSVMTPTVIMITKNNTNNTFSNVTTPLTFSADAITSGDYNNDGNKDLLISYFIGPTGFVEFLAGNGAYGFAAPVNVLSSTPNNFRELKSYDFNNDGYDDLVSADGYGMKGGMYLCSSTTNFTYSKKMPRGLVSDMGFRDLNNDGYKDIVYPNSMSGDNLNVMNGNAAYSYSLITRYAQCGAPTSLSLNDLNNDGFLDAITGGLYNGTSNSAYCVSLGSSTKLNAAVYFQTYPPDYYDDIGHTVGDFNNDGLLDLAINGDTVRVYQNTGSGNFIPVYKQKIGTNNAWAIEATDVNKDGNLDLVCAADNGTTYAITTLRGNGNFTFQSPQNLLMSSSFQVAEIKAFDFNNDGYPDIMTSQGLFKNNGGVNFSSFPGMTLAAREGFDHGDFNNDGFEDMLYVKGFNTVCTEINNSGTSFAPQQVLLYALLLLKMLQFLIITLMEKLISVLPMIFAHLSLTMFRSLKVLVIILSLP